VLPQSTEIAERRPRFLLTIPAKWAGLTLESLLAILNVEQGAGLDEQLITTGAIWLDRRRVQDPAHPVVEGQILAVHFPPSDGLVARVSAADILYEDDALLVLNKPPGVYVTMTPWDATNDLLYATRRFLATRDGIPPVLHLAHQLDRDTSGVLLFSKDPRANAPLQAMFTEHRIRKRYLTLVTAPLGWDEVEVRTGHGRGGQGLFRIYPLEDVGAVLPGGQVVKSMETHFRVVERFEGATLLEARPITGRTHQIRLHLLHLGAPIAGDLRYGGTSSLVGMSLTHHLLHAGSMELAHPRDGRALHFEAPLPPLFAAALARLANDRT
jgi:23S rRNA pseudouridine1911/1915/1917 synthase